MSQIVLKTGSLNLLETSGPLQAGNGIALPLFYLFIFSGRSVNRYGALTLTLLTWRIWWAPNNASKWQMGFNLAFKGLMFRVWETLGVKPVPSQFWTLIFSPWVAGESIRASAMTRPVMCRIGDKVNYNFALPSEYIIIIIIIIIIINCNWVVTRWQWLFYMYTKYEIGY